MKKYLIALLALALLFASCATSNNSNNQTTVLIKGDNTPQREFASDEIRTSLSERGIREVESNADYVIRFADNDYKLTEQSYRVEVLGKVIEITGIDFQLKLEEKSHFKLEDRNKSKKLYFFVLSKEKAGKSRQKR